MLRVAAAILPHPSLISVLGCCRKWCIIQFASFAAGLNGDGKKTLFRQAATPATFLTAIAQLLSELSLEHSRNLSTFSRRTTGHGCFTPWRIANFVASFITPMARGWEGVEYTTLCSSHRKHEAEEGRTRNPMFPLSWELFLVGPYPLLYGT